MKKILLCADDYGLHPAIDGAVIHLAKLGRLHATSCMTDAPRWAETAQALVALRAQLPQFQTGLHFNLTEGYGSGDTALWRIMLQSWARTLSPRTIRAKLNQQLDAFEKALGSAPDYLDGHQHVHQFPVIRDAVLDVLTQRYGTPPHNQSLANPRPIWLRSTLPADPSWTGKASLLARLGGKAFTKKLDALGMAHNNGFAGVYDFAAADEAAYATLMRDWLRGAQDGTLVMCHPSLAVIEGDAIAVARVLEYRVLSSDEFGVVLNTLG